MKESVKVALRSMAAGVGIALILSGTLFAAVGVWPPMVSVVSESMEPNIEKGDLVVVKDPGRFEEQPAVDTHRSTTEVDFGKKGDVIVYEPHGKYAVESGRVIHRAMFEVEKGENWYKSADKSFIPPTTNSCDELQYCPAPNDGYITKGDSNDYYDQAGGISKPVQDKWVFSEAVLAVPLFGYLRIMFPLLLAVLGAGLAILSIAPLVRGFFNSETDESDKDRSLTEENQNTEAFGVEKEE